MATTQTIATSIVNSQPEHWKYVSEGGATIVFSYTGPSSPHFDNTVLRLRKSLVSPVKDDKNIDDPDDPMVDFQEKCITKLIPSEHLPRLETVILERSWLERLHDLHEHSRPDGRRQKDRIDLAKKKGVLATDLVGGDWLAVEIKPKWAFLPSPAHLSAETRDIKLRTCRFCMHSHLKAKKVETVALGYCPLDLFSGDKARVDLALHNLWDSWKTSNGTVNNLKVFARGKLINPSSLNLMLSKDVKDDESETVIRETFISALSYLLLATPVLEILSRLQRSLDTLDIEGLSALWKRAEVSSPFYQPSQSQHLYTPIGTNSELISALEPKVSDWIEFVDRFKSHSNSELDHSNPTPENLRYYLLSSLLSGTFKDCSIIARLDFLRPRQSSRPEIKRNTVTIIDLDNKSMSKVKGWEELDTEIVTEYSKVVTPKVCVDARRT